MIAKSFSRKQGSTKNFHQTFFGRKFFIVAKSFPRKQFCTEDFHQTLFTRNFFMIANLFSRIPRSTETFHQKCFGRKFFIVAKSFPENSFAPKIFIKIFLVLIFYDCKIIISKTGIRQKFSKNF